MILWIFLRLLLVAVAIVGSGGAGVPQGGVGWSSMASSVPETTLLHWSSRSANGSGQRLSGVDEVCASFVSARVVFGHDRLIRRAKVGAEMIDHDGNQGTTHDATQERRLREACGGPGHHK